MSNKTVYNILLDYFEQRKNANLDTKSIKRRLQKIGKNEHQVDEIMIEFVDEWERQMAHERETKNATFFVFGGAFLTLGVGTVSIMSALNIQPFARIPVIWYGGVAAGLFFTFRGLNLQRQKKSRFQRLKVKYEKW
ncbi:MAG: hypothetical protein ACFHU9_12545 [Fluviicola sp.]